jgi:hypothetical protein
MEKTKKRKKYEVEKNKKKDIKLDILERYWSKWMKKIENKTNKLDNNWTLLIFPSVNASYSSLQRKYYLCTDSFESYKHSFSMSDIQQYYGKTKSDLSIDEGEFELCSNGLQCILYETHEYEKYHMAFIYARAAIDVYRLKNKDKLSNEEYTKIVCTVLGINNKFGLYEINEIEARFDERWKIYSHLFNYSTFSMRRLITDSNNKFIYCPKTYEEYNLGEFEENFKGLENFTKALFSI